MPVRLPFGADHRKSERESVRTRTSPLRRLVESTLMRRLSYKEYRDKVCEVYSGPQGALLAASSIVSLHTPMGERLFRTRKFDLRGVRRALDVGSGAGQIAKHLLKYGESGIDVTCVDISTQMLRRARQRIRNSRLRWFTADVTALPFADATFDCVTCGYVLEHLPDISLGLRELSRVLVPGGRMLLLVTEDSISGAWTSRLWRCRTHNRDELRQTCHRLGLVWRQELWFSKMHEVLHAGGICVEVQKPASD